MNNQDSADPARAIIEELDPTGLHRLLNDLWDHPREFNREIHALVLLGLNAMVEGIGIWEEQQLTAQRAGRFERRVAPVR